MTQVGDKPVASPELRLLLRWAQYQAVGCNTETEREALRLVNEVTEQFAPYPVPWPNCDMPSLAQARREFIDVEHAIAAGRWGEVEQALMGDEIPQCTQAVISAEDAAGGKPVAYIGDSTGCDDLVRMTPEGIERLKALHRSIERRGRPQIGEPGFRWQVGMWCLRRSGGYARIYELKDGKVYAGHFSPKGDDYLLMHEVDGKLSFVPKSYIVSDLVRVVGWPK